MFELNYRIKIKNDKNTVYNLKKVHGKSVTVDDIEGGLLWEPKMLGSDQVILLNKSHPFYRKVYWQLRKTPLATQGFDFLLFALANAEWMTRTDRAKEQFFQMRLMMANTLRTLVAEIEDSPDANLGDEAFGDEE